MKAIERKDDNNAFSKHLMIHHPEEEGNIGAFEFCLAELHSQPLPRLASESCYIHNNNVDIPMNSKAEWHQPAVGRVVVTRALEELQEPRAGSVRRRRGGQGEHRGAGL